MQTDRIIPFGDGEYTVKLGMAQIFAVQEKTGRGIGEIYARVIQGRMQDNDTGFHFGYGPGAQFSMEDVLEVCRQGLIGGGSGFVDGRDVKVTDHLATHLVKTYIHPENGNPIRRAWDMAAIIMDLAMNGYQPAVDEQKKSPETATAEDGSTEAGQSETA